MNETSPQLIHLQNNLDLTTWTVERKDNSLVVFTRYQQAVAQWSSEKTPISQSVWCVHAGQSRKCYRNWDYVT